MKRRAMVRPPMAIRCCCGRDLVSSEVRSLTETKKLCRHCTESWWDEQMRRIEAGRARALQLAGAA